MPTRPANAATPEELERFLALHPDIDGVDLLLPDLNGVLRGSRVRREALAGIVENGACMGASTPLLDARGVLPEGAGAGEFDGDPDQPCFPVPGSFAPVPWAGPSRGQCLLQMYGRDGAPWHADSRQLLQRVCARLRELGLTPVIALELEFYLLAAGSEERPRPWLAPVPGTALHGQGGQLHDLAVLEPLEDLLAELHVACAGQGLPVSGVMSESGPGQFEITLRHQADAVLACDHAVLLRRLVRAIARRRGLGATFMAKPFSEHEGCGMHVHLSLQGPDGRNLFAGNPPAGAPEAYAPALRQAAAGLLATLPEALALWAPNANSYRRIRPGHFVPTTASWSSNHRAAAVRVPLADEANVRLEHRCAGADANPYLVVAAVLAGVHHGLLRRLDPPPVLREGQHFQAADTPVPCWEQALEAFEQARVLRGYFGEAFCRTYARARRAEAAAYRAQVPELDYSWYLGSV